MKILILLMLFLLTSACSQQDVYNSAAVSKSNYSKSVIAATALSDDGKLTVVVNNQGVCLWQNNQQSTMPQCLPADHAQHIEIAYISKNNQFLYLSNRVSVKQYTTDNLQIVGEWQVADNIINDISASKSGQLLLLGFRSGKASIIDTKANKVTTFQKHRLDINAVSLSENGQIAFTGSSDKKAQLWNTSTGKTLFEFSHASRVNHVDISSDGLVGFSIDAIKDRKFWNLQTGQLIAELGTYLKFMEVNDSVFSTDKQLFLTGSPRQVLQLWRVADGALLAQWQSVMENGRASVLSVAMNVGRSETIENAKSIKSIHASNSDGIVELWHFPVD
ncbi:WD40 repeat domain-containing protein [Colwellia hornerae]|uniref:WD40 repeat domain-containing protein n=1 Tax=Colwellia hornerae TaxID=89402 RepID=A0A5C6Q7M8_9GAMM|nr:WD40 repeat domain-containing protein [Colwellia hornerae]TWX50595.1 WD40 repeat domain-containing protein [Colwellia hornerae]TWX56151.1 WD40 repeat domain-containing protein [Colwellia hornerae]TWX64995.1 WD40 repeat domain-containing protein [Colwellia hornerae]